MPIEMVKAHEDINIDGSNHLASKCHWAEHEADQLPTRPALSHTSHTDGIE